MRATNAWAVLAVAACAAAIGGCGGSPDDGAPLDGPPSATTEEDLTGCKAPHPGMYAYGKTTSFAYLYADDRSTSGILGGVGAGVGLEYWIYSNGWICPKNGFYYVRTANHWSTWGWIRGDHLEDKVVWTD